MILIINCFHDFGRCIGGNHVCQERNDDVQFQLCHSHDFYTEVQMQQDTQQTDTFISSSVSTLHASWYRLNDVHQVTSQELDFQSCMMTTRRSPSRQVKKVDGDFCAVLST
eukprot:1156161_1